MKNQRGVTLIALVVTIIVLLILAGVSIAMLKGDNGLLTEASNAKEASVRAEVIDRVNMELAAQFAKKMGPDGKFDTTVTFEDIPTGYSATATVNQDTGIVVTVTEPTGLDKLNKTGIGIAKEDGKWKLTPLTEKTATN